MTGNNKINKTNPHPTPDPPFFPRGLGYARLMSDLTVKNLGDEWADMTPISGILYNMTLILCNTNLHISSCS